MPPAPRPICCACIDGLTFFAGWRALQRPLVRSVMRLGQAWVLGVVAPAGDAAAVPVRGGRAVMDDEGRWLVPDRATDLAAPR
ncbi:hypothetical protein [Variovorax sp. PAMC 28711]|uniref:hypothetical protein n=1 Tax=Variovorax sp. PAMC 28711 TaxID=1795631 RepID=UPI000A92EDA7|nr:hypothetical protein [Variovorax sp. PAMC 28711]